MIGLEWTPAVRVIAGAERLSGRRTARNATMILDPAVPGAPIHRRTHDLMSRRGWRTTDETLRGPGDVDAVLALADRLADADLVVAIGGGTVIDQVKIASAVAGSARLRAGLTAPTRSGLITAAIGTFRPAPLIAVPTTLGTGSEVSAVAALRYPTTKRLVAGLALVPDAAVVDPVATLGLPAWMVAEAAFEVLCRLMYPYVCAGREVPGQDRLTEAAAGQLIRLGFDVDHLRRSARPIPSHIRTELAALSGFSQSWWMGRFDEPFSAKPWLIANELSSFTGVRKMTAVTAILPEVSARITRGDERLGSAARLHRLWRLLHALAPIPLPADPAAGITALMHRWRVAGDIRLDVADVPVLARRISRAWGAGLPMLAGLRTEDLTDLLAAALTRPRELAEAATELSAPAPAGAGAVGH